MGIEIRLARDITLAIVAQGRRAWPREACGLLLGPVAQASDSPDKGESGVVAAILPATNVAVDPSRFFEIDPAVLIAAHRAMRFGGPPVVGCYHSHPSGRAAPSARDSALAQMGGGQIWAIAAPDNATPEIAGARPSATLWRIGWWRAGHNGFEMLSTTVDDG